MIQALLFDLDGTLFDSSEANVAAYAQAFLKAGIAFDEQAYRSHFGLRFPEMMHELASEASKEQLASIKVMKAAAYKSNLNLVRKNDGLLALLQSAQGVFNTALVTTASKANVLNLLEYFSVSADLFNTMVTGEDVTNSKPDPECYQIAIQTLGIPAENCLVFEDTDIGITAAKAARAQTVRVAI